jgi:hypothetical protein
MSMLEDAWRSHGRTVRWLGVAYLAVAAVGKLHFALPHLLRDVAAWSALDFKYRYHEVAEWFAGRPVYGVVDGAVYPPASHVILWPFMGWTSLDTARLIWAATILFAAASLSFIIHRITSAAPSRDRLLAAGLALAAYPLQQSVFVGQLGVHVAALAAGGAALLFRPGPALWSDGLAALLLAASLVKPQLSVPLVAAALIAASRARPIMLTAAVYGILTLVAAALQPAGLLALTRDWIAITGTRVPFLDGVPNVHMLLAAIGAGSWMTPVSLVLLGALMLWLWRRRAADPWLLMGVAGIMTRFWAHSTTYDDAFLLLPAAALMRIVYERPHEGRAAAWLFAACWVALLTPTWAFYDLPPAHVWILHGAQTGLWLVVLAFLLAQATRKRADARSTVATQALTPAQT